MRLNGRTLITFIFLNLIVFQDVLTDNGFGFMTYFDEVVVLLVFIYAIGLKSKLRFKKNEALFLGFTCGYYIWGWICQLIYKIQPISIAFQSSLLSIKFFLLLCGVIIIADHSKKIEKLILRLYKIVWPQTCVLAIFVLITEGFNLEVFIWPWDLCAKSILLVLITLSNWKNTSKDKLCIIVNVLLLLSTGKAKAFAALGIIALIIIWVLKKSKRIRWYHILISAVIVVALAWKKIAYYYIYGYGRFARSLLTITGFKIAADYFPFGLGWGSFASYYSGVNYSTAYYLYGLNTHGEIGENTKAFLMDTYWPSVLGETGWIGCILIVFILVILFCKIQSQYRVNLKYYAAGITGFAYLIVTTFEESGFMQPNLIWIALILGAISANKTLSITREHVYIERKTYD